MLSSRLRQFITNQRKKALKRASQQSKRNSAITTISTTTTTTTTTTETGDALKSLLGIQTVDKESVKVHSTIVEELSVQPSMSDSMRRNSLLSLLQGGLSQPSSTLYQPYIGE